MTLKGMVEYVTNFEEDYHGEESGEYEDENAWMFVPAPGHKETDPLVSIKRDPSIQKE